MWQYTFFQTAPMAVETDGIAGLWDAADEEGNTSLAQLRTYFEQGYEVQWTQLLLTSREHAFYRMVFMLRRPKP
jgi:hypothetical protein